MAAGGVSEEVLVGVGRLWMAPIGTTEPTSASSAMPSAWTAIGYTDQGHEYTTDITSEPVEVAEEVDPIRYEVTRRISSVTFAMAQATRQRLAAAFGHGADESDDAAVLETPVAGSEVGVMLVWDSEDDADGNADNVRWIYRQGKPSGSLTIQHRKSPQKKLIPVTFNLEKPTGLEAVRVFPNSSGHIA